MKRAGLIGTRLELEINQFGFEMVGWPPGMVVVRIGSGADFTKAHPRYRWDTPSPYHSPLALPQLAIRIVNAARRVENLHC